MANRSGRSSPGLALIVIVALHWSCMGACDLMVPTKSLPGEYALIQFEGQQHYIVKNGAKFGGGGVLQGTISALGWNEHYIVAKRVAMSSKLRSGWMIISVQNGQIVGPFNDEELAEAQERDAALGSVEISAVGEAWEKL